MTKTDIVNLLCERMGLTKQQARMAVGILISSIKESLLAGQKVSLRDLGSFAPRRRKAREVVNPQTQKPIQVGEHSTIVFRAGDGLKRRLKKDPNLSTDEGPSDLQS